MEFFKIQKQTLNSPDDELDQGTTVDLASEKIQEFLKDYKHSEYDGKQKAWRGYNDEPYPQDRYFYK